ncbi:hypothetical protein BC939DRAFT_447853 [Gamsiella multidivaricata]|uniref:uncharacterized protein n=1 Tax=Gamsiella multidivaricata TaxID=101098 RepID=UPI002220DB0A|nr:uncharacterized protein BC939DRAFT_447853 [Gamsiella multidivaricata]KAG0352502.1 hypothetical protein BGZ54_002749 [Gamsiella multidivaricata]KAI7825611.1 hypothetical protein BC939DRAFT_447853 [Gamsiella multidivaricata]
MMANKSNVGLDSVTTLPDPSLHTTTTNSNNKIRKPLRIKTTTDAEPLDRNSDLALYIAPPAPSHPNTSTRRQSAAHAAPLSSPMSPFSAMSDIALNSAKTTTPSSATRRTSAIAADHNSSTILSSLPTSGTTQFSFALESPPVIELQSFINEHTTATTPRDRSAVQWSNSLDMQDPSMDQTQHHQHQSSQNSGSFFQGFFAIPPSLAGRPRLTEDQEEYWRRECERGPVPLMWPKQHDLENQTATDGDTTNSSGWFSSWWAPMSKDPTETRREGAMAQ